MKTSNLSKFPVKLSHFVIDDLVEANHTLVAKNKSIAIHEELIQIKKDRDEKNKVLKPLFLNIGMAISLLIVIVAINWKSYNEVGLVDLGQIQADMDEIIDIPISKQPPPPPPKQELFKIEEVNNKEIVEELQIVLDVEVTEETALEEIEIMEPIEEEDVVDEIFVIVEQEPLPEGGIDAFYEYVGKNLKYPATAMRLGISGIVFVQFVIEKDGSLTQVEVVKGIGAGCDEETIRVIESAPDWNPGKQRGVAVRVKKIMPIRFVIR